MNRSITQCWPIHLLSLQNAQLGICKRHHGSPSSEFNFRTGESNGTLIALMGPGQGGARTWPQAGIHGGSKPFGKTRGHEFEMDENKLIYLIIKRSRINKKLTPYCAWIEMSKHILGPLGVVSVCVCVYACVCAWRCLCYRTTVPAVVSSVSYASRAAGHTIRNCQYRYGEGGRWLEEIDTRFIRGQPWRQREN